MQNWLPGCCYTAVLVPPANMAARFKQKESFPGSNKAGFKQTIAFYRALPFVQLIVVLCNLTIIIVLQLKFASAAFAIPCVAKYIFPDLHLNLEFS